MFLNEVESELRRFFSRATPRAGAVIDKLPADARLWNVIDSLTLLDLVEFLEYRYTIRIEPEVFTPEHFETIERIVLLVAKRAQGDS